MDHFEPSFEPVTDNRTQPAGYRWLLTAMGVYLAGLMVYAQTFAYTGDEGFHLETDQLILAGLRPYLDFCYPQASLNNYWNVLWMNLFGESWRAVHTVATVLTAVAVFLMADFVFRRFPVPRFKLAAGLSVLFLLGLNQLIVEYGPLAQAYGICLFGTVAAFRCALVAIKRPSPWMALATGLSVGIGTASSLLTAAAPAVLLLWIFFRSSVGNRWLKAAAVAFGVVVPFTPMILLFSKGPKQVWFNMVQYHVVFRKLYWSDTTRHDLEVMTSWIDSGHALLLGLLALAGLIYIARRSSWMLALRSEFYLCGWMSLALMAEVATAHPTFARYFLLAVPFAAALAAIGVCIVVSRVAPSLPRRWPLLALAFLMLFNLGKSLYERRDMFNWPQLEDVARRIHQVTPPGGLLWADEQVHFIARMRPMPGMEFGYSHKVILPAPEMKLLHILSQDEVNRLVKARTFATIFSCDSDDIDGLGLNSLYGHKAEMYDCTLFWGPPDPNGTSAVPDAKLSVPSK